MRHIKKKYYRVCLSVLVCISLLLSEFSVVFLYPPNLVYAAQVQIDDSVSTGQDEHTIAGAASVFISDQVGYKFYTNSTGVCQYAKTTNGGTSWGTPQTFDSQTDCSNPVIWYDQWTPGATTSFIHIASQDQGGTDGDDIRYNRLDTSDDSLLVATSTNVTQPLGYAGTIAAGSNFQAITRGTDGTIYIGIGDASDSLIVECTTNCGDPANWSETGTTPLDNQTDPILLLPQANGNIMLIRRDLNLDDVQYQIWDNSSWPGPTGWSTIDSGAIENGTYDVMMAAVVNDDFDIFLAYIEAANYNVGTVYDLRTAKYSGSWTNKTDVLTDDTRGLTNVSIGLDANTDDVYVAYSIRATNNNAATADVLWATSTSAMNSWGAEQGPVNSSQDNIYGVDINHRSDQRVYVSWYGITPDDMLGDTLADVSPQTIVSSLGTQVATRRASTSATHIGGAIVIQEFKGSRYVNSIEITETGSIDGSTGVGDISLVYDLDTSAPYDCAGESYGGGETPYGLTDTNGFSGADGVSIFSGAVEIDTDQAMCVYPVIEILSAADDATSLEIEVADPASDISLSAGYPVVPDAAIAIAGTTDIVNSTLTQTHYHWRNDNGNEAGATSRTSGTEDTALSAIQLQVPVRLRLGLSNEGSTSTIPATYRLQYSSAPSSCDLASGWTNVSDSAVGAVPVVQSFQTTSSGASSVSSLNMTAPTGITAGELLLIIVANDDTTATAQFSNNLSGWNFIGTSGNGSSQAHIGAFWKVANGTEGNVTVTAQSADNMYGWYIRISGANTANPINVSNFTQSAGDSNSRAIPEVTTSVANTLGIYGLSFDGGDGDPFSISGTGWAEQGELTAGTLGTEGAGVWGTKSVTSAGGTGVATVGSSVSDGAAYFQMAINPRVNPTGSGQWYLSGSSYLSDGANTTDISNGIGGVTNENSTLLTPNGGIRTYTAETGSLTFTPSNFTEFEYAIVASTTATEGESYCFRMVDDYGTLPVYTNYPRLTIAADVTVSALGSQVASANIPTTNLYTGGAFAITENASARNVTSITLTEGGTVDGSVGLDNIRLRYELDSVAPYDCASVSYGGTESFFGASDTDGFSGANGTSTFTGSVAISTTSAMCVYPVLDITESAQNGETIDLTINSGSADVQVSGGGSVAPSLALDITGSTTLQGGIMSQAHYHWRADNGTEVTASSSVGAEDTPQTEHSRNTPIRLRLGIDNLGPTTSVPTAFRLEYGIKLSTCENVSVWTDVDAVGDAWDMYNSLNLTEGANTTDVSGAGYGEVTNPGGKTFISSNGGVRDTSSETGNLTLTTAQFVELEYSITSTASTSYATDYCFRVTDAGSEIPSYAQYAELTTAPKRDFKVQRGTTVVTGTNVTVTPGGSTYTAPASTSLAFVRITNMHHTGAGRTVGDNTQEADDETVYISDASDLTTGFTLTRYSATNNSVVSWEIVEFIGEPGTDNEIQVRTIDTIALTGANQTATGTALSNISNDADVVVFITGIANSNTATAYYNGQVTSKWNSDTNEPVFERIGAGSTVSVSYAVVEFTGINWNTQRVEHSFTKVNEFEPEIIAPVNSLSRTFLHTQKRLGAVSQQANFGHEVYLSSIGAVSFKLSRNAATTSGQVSVAWVIENTQTSEGKMVVQRKSDSISGGTEPRTTSVSITEVDAMNNTSVFAMSAFEQNTTNYPRVLGGVILASTTAFQIYNSDIDGTIPYYYRAEIVEWPTTGLSVQQNYYRWYVDNDALDPTDAWPAGPLDVGENTTITATDEPIEEGNTIRLRLSLKVSNASLPAGLRTLKLQFAPRAGSSCTAVETWTDVGAIGSGEIWRGYDTSVTDGVELATSTPAPGTLNLTLISDVAGRFVEENPSAANPYDVEEDQDVEYDFVLQHNGAAGSTFYCFRVVNSDGEPIDGYTYYPQLRTAGFTPVSTDWRWYEDEENPTPSVALASENVAPTDIPFQGKIALRVAMEETKNVPGNDVKFKLQFSQSPTFADGGSDVVATSTCTASSTWCYADGAGTDNEIISTSTLTATDACVAGVGAGCGTYNEQPLFVAGDTHEASAVREYQFVIEHAGARAGGVYYFRLYDLLNEQPVAASTSYPSLVAQSGQLTFTSEGLPSGTTTEGITTDVSTASTSISFGEVPFNTEYEAAYRLSIDTNATEGYQVFMMTDQQLLNGYSEPIPDVAGTNAVPVGWSTGCNGLVACFGYHTGDDSLYSGSARFAPDDSYAAVTTTPVEVAYSSIPTSESHDIVYKIQTSEEQSAGTYSMGVSYIVVPVY